MGTQAANLADRVGDDREVFRAFSAEGFRRRPNKIRVAAFRRSKDHEDGISVGLTPKDAISGLKVNFGYCALAVGRVHALPYDLAILTDLKDPGHALITNVPPIDGTDQERERAEEIAGVLARLARMVTCDTYTPLPNV